MKVFLTARVFLTAFCLFIFALLSVASLMGAENSPEPLIPDRIESDQTEADCSCEDEGEDFQSANYLNVFTTPEEAAAFIEPELRQVP
ncbi:MAG: hypothetical protein R3C11_20480 [Planctomycetaceae bacterium]